MTIWDCVAVGRADECWPYQKTLDRGGYGVVKAGRTTARAHRVAYKLACGEIPAGLVVMHRCDNRACCNPDHLEVGTQADNMRDMVSKGRSARHEGVENGRAVLTPDQVMAIRADPRGTRSIARDFPVSRAAVQRIKSGRAWACV